MDEIIIIPSNNGGNPEIEPYSGYICGWGCSDNSSGWICAGEEGK